MITPTLANIGGGDINIQSLGVKNSDMGGTTIQLMNEQGQWDDEKMSYWYAAFEDLPAGWYDQTGYDLKDFTIKQGEAVFASVQDSGVCFSSAGEVAGEHITPLPNTGFTMVGNSTPVLQPLNSFTVNGGSDMGNTTIQFMTEDGKWDDERMSYWYAAFEDLPAGWYDQTGYELHEFNLNPGESVFISTQEADLELSITIPAAIK